MDERRFWSMIEAAWKLVGEKTEVRQLLAKDGEPEAMQTLAYALDESLESVMTALEEQLAELSAGELLAFDRILEKKLYDIDRADIHERTDGSDDGFLYCRGFIVALGQRYYEAVRNNPALALVDAECEHICYVSWHLYLDRFGEVPPSGISRESCSNLAGWPKDF